MDLKDKFNSHQKSLEKNKSLWNSKVIDEIDGQFFFFKEVLNKSDRERNYTPPAPVRDRS